MPMPGRSSDEQGASCIECGGTGRESIHSVRRQSWPLGTSLGLGASDAGVGIVNQNGAGNGTVAPLPEMGPSLSGANRGWGGMLRASVRSGFFGVVAEGVSGTHPNVAPGPLQFVHRDLAANENGTTRVSGKAWFNETEIAPSVGRLHERSAQQKRAAGRTDPGCSCFC